MATERFITIHSLDEIPRFANEDEEHAFWATHEFSEALWDAAPPPEQGELPEPDVLVTLRLRPGTVKRAKALARRRHLSYQLLLRDILTSHFAKTHS